MKNIYTYISVAVVMLVMMVASAFLLTAADAPVRAAGGAIATWATAKALLAERDNEERRASDHAHNHA